MQGVGPVVEAREMYRDSAGNEKLGVARALGDKARALHGFSNSIVARALGDKARALREFLSRIVSCFSS